MPKASIQNPVNASKIESLSNHNSVHIEDDSHYWFYAIRKQLRYKVDPVRVPEVHYCTH